MEIKQNISLKQYNTFGIDAKAAYYVEITSVDELRQVLQLKEFPKKFVLSGGSNILLTRNIESLVLHLNIKGIKVVWEDQDQVVIKVMAGENWHDLVLWTLEQDYGGLENLSLIPGNTGTAPIQNIGAYGVELKDTFESCEAMLVATQRLLKFSKSGCQFGYRDSFFKNEGKGKFIITSVNFKLSKKDHILNTSYGAIEAEFQKRKIEQPTIKDVSNAVVAIRQSKLPDPKKHGNSGSFFKNPVLNEVDFKVFAKNCPDAPYYKISEDTYKIPAGWLIEQCGFKGKKFGDTGVHEKQALVLVNLGNATGLAILDLAHRIQKEVSKKFDIKISLEVNIID